MSCFFCKGKLENKNTTYKVDLADCSISIKNVPSQVCSRCGEVSYIDEVAKQLEILVNLSELNSQKDIVINYTDKIV